jgi:predicted nucleic acid-binding protein
MLRWIAAGAVHADAPGLIVAEAGNALAVSVRGGHIPHAEASDMLRWVIDGPIERHEDAILGHAAFAASVLVGLSVHDGLYAVLAESLGVPLVTADRRLAERVSDAVLVT